MDPVKTLSFSLKPCLKDCQGRDPPLTAGGSAGSLWPNKSTKGCFWDGGDWIKSGRKKKAQNNNWQWVDGGMLSVCARAVRETVRSSTIEISTCLHFCSGRILLRPLWRALTQLSRLTASERHPPAHKGPPRPSAEPWKGGKSKTEGMLEKKIASARSNEERESKKAREWNEREERGWRAFSQRSR